MTKYKARQAAAVTLLKAMVHPLLLLNHGVKTFKARKPVTKAQTIAP